MLDDRTIVFIDDEGNEETREIIFTFEADENDPKFKGNKYVIFHDPLDESGQVGVARYDDEGHLFQIPQENIEEWEMIEEVFNAFIEDDEEDEE